MKKQTDLVTFSGRLSTSEINLSNCQFNMVVFPLTISFSSETENTLISIEMTLSDTFIPGIISLIRYCKTQDFELYCLDFNVKSAFTCYGFTGCV